MVVRGGGGVFDKGGYGMDHAWRLSEGTIGEGLAFRPISCLTLSLMDGDFTQGPHIDSGLTDYKSWEKLT